MNLGYVYARVDAPHIEVRTYGNVDITRETRSRELWDRLVDVEARLLGPLAREADVVLIERQPPTGIGTITAFWYSRYRDKIVLVHPRSVHKMFGMGHLSYDMRKRASVDIASKFIPDLGAGGGGRRVHDVADALVMICFHVRATRVQPVAKPPHEWMDAFKFFPDC